MNKIKILLIATIILIIATPLSVFAQTFEDVVTDAWYFDYVEQLVDDEIIDEAVNFRPNDNLNRAEFVKMVIVAIDGMANYTIPTTPTFSDVESNEWYYDYIESAVNTGIISGYKDSNENFTGVFGPNDTINRASATKILINSFAFSIDTDPQSIFPDVNEGDWFYDYVITAYNNHILNGYANGYFGPADPITRAQAAKLIVIAMNPLQINPPTENLTEEPVEEPEEEPVEEETGIPAIPNNSAINSINLPNNSNQVFVSRYNFNALYEDVNITTLTVVNDLTGNNLGDDPVSTPAVKSITIKYPDENGFLKTAESILYSDGKARFTDLDFFAYRYEDAFLEIYADINSVSDVGESLSGKVIRIGLQNKNNDSNSFKATGDASLSNISLTSLVSASEPPNQFIIRKTVPKFTIINDNSRLFNGDNTLIEFQISADEMGSLSFGRIVFDLSVSDSAGSNLALNNFKLFRDSSLLDDEVNIYDATGGSDITDIGGGSIVNGFSDIIISFNEVETISAGSSRTYRLRANAMNVEDGDTIVTNIARGDQDTPLSGLSKNTNENTGRIYKSGDATDGIFTNANDFSQALGINHNIIWSDKSADLYSYPEVINGTVTDGSGSYDWTNGYLLDVYSLPEVLIIN